MIVPNTPPLVAESAPFAAPPVGLAAVELPEVLGEVAVSLAAEEEPEALTVGARAAGMSKHWLRYEVSYRMDDTHCQGA